MPRKVKCDVCGRCFRRECDKARHKCMVERRRPVHEQVGAVRCTVCGRWLRSRGGLAAHRCGRQHENATSQADNPRPGQEVVCGECGRRFSRPGDSKRHKCAMERAKSVEEQTGAVQCVVCQKWFRSTGGQCCPQVQITWLAAQRLVP